MKHQLYLLTIILFSSFSFIHAKPKIQAAIVNLDAVPVSVEPIYLLGTNYYSFISQNAIDTVYLKNDTVKWKVERTGQNEFNFQTELHQMSNQLSYMPNMEMTVIFKNQSQMKIPVQLVPFPIVRISLHQIGVNKTEIIDDVAIGLDSFYFYAKWIYPQHVKSYMRFKGHFGIRMYAKDGEYLGGKDGWYDAGDRTKVFRLSAFKKMEYVTLKLEKKRVTSLFYRYIKGDKPPLEFASDSFEELKIIMPKIEE